MVMPSMTSERSALGSRVSCLRSRTSARAVGSVNTRSGSRKVCTELRPFWSSASDTNSIIVTLRPAHGELVRSRTKESETFFEPDGTGRSMRMTSGSSSSVSMSEPSTEPCRRIWSCTPVTPKSSPAM